MTWADTDYGYRKHITVDHTKVITADCTDYPMLIFVTDANLAHTTHGGHCTSLSGFDIIFYGTDDATVLKHELVSYNHETGAIEAWVKIPTLTTAADTVIHMYYGNSNIVATQNSTDTWNANYKIVQHLKDLTTSTTFDSTSNGINGVKVAANQPIETTGMIGKVQDFDGSNDTINFGTGLIQSGSGTISVWMKFQDGGDNADRLFITKRNTTAPAGTNYQFSIYGPNQGANGGKIAYYNGTTQTALNYVIPTNEWTYLTFVRSAANVIDLYVNGAYHSSWALDWGTTGDAKLIEIGGSSTVGVGYYNECELDEFRESNVAKTANWIHTEFHNQDNPSTFMSFGAEETANIAWTLTLSDSMAISDSFQRQVDYQRTLTDSMTMSDYFARQVAYIRNISDSLTISDLILKSLGKNLTLSDSMSISDSILTQFGIGHVLSLFDSMSILDTFNLLLTVSPNILFTYTGGSILLHKPYPRSASGNLTFSGSNFSFRSGNYASYIEEIDDETIALSGYENDGAMGKFTALGIVADDGLEVTITNLHDEFNGVYIIQNISYEPIGLDIFEYRLTLRFVRELP